ncbi:hypothetical protein SAMN05216308_101552 [Nitrosospira sp. Nsp13]|nr:hypothetical protein SAMN05216308_101552 [Nitrosospira sp. Nsp13]
MVVAISPDRVIKHFDVIEHITPCLLAVGIDSSAYLLRLSNWKNSWPQHCHGFTTKQ